jgi:DNA-binding CsgD family transcriptional regulator
VLAGRSFAEAGDGDRAVEELQRAAAIFEACGAVRYRDGAERELGKLGHRPHRRTRSGLSEGRGIETLTERELQLARLVVDRKTNREIAAELFLSQKTVETHLRNMFHKMDVTDRVALARAFERTEASVEDDRSHVGRSWAEVPRWMSPTPRGARGEPAHFRADQGCSGSVIARRSTSRFVRGFPSWKRSPWLHPNRWIEVEHANAGTHGGRWSKRVHGPDPDGRKARGFLALFYPSRGSGDACGCRAHLSRG